MFDRKTTRATLRLYLNQRQLTHGHALGGRFCLQLWPSLKARMAARSPWGWASIPSGAPAAGVGTTLPIRERTISALRSYALAGNKRVKHPRSAFQYASSAVTDQPHLSGPLSAKRSHGLTQFYANQRALADLIRINATRIDPGIFKSGRSSVSTRDTVKLRITTRCTKLLRCYGRNTGMSSA